MTPDQLTTLASIIEIIGSVNSWPFGMILFSIILGPWLAAFGLAFFQSRRFEKVVTMYENNVRLVEDYARLSRDLHDVVIMNTQISTKLVENINTNQYCPSIRLEKKAGGTQT